MPKNTHEFNLSIEGMSCASCVGRVEKALLAVSGVSTAEVNLASEHAKVVTSPITSSETLIAAIKQAGYSAHLLIAQEASPAESTRTNKDFWLILAAIGLTLPLVLPMIADLFGIHIMLPAWLQWMIATPIQFWLGARFYRAGWNALRAGETNMDVLVALGTSAAYGLSLYNWITSHSSMPILYFEGSAVVITLVRLGKWLESRAKHQTTTAIRALQALRPETALLRIGSNTHEVSISTLKIDDEIMIRAGERIPLDGVIVEGQTHVDESMMTGESLPIAKHEGDAVIGGTMNTEGLIAIRITAIGKDTLLARIINAVENAQIAKAPIQRIVDRVSTVFVPSILAIATLTLLGWGFTTGNWTQGILNAVSVLVVACPCALGLATPTAIITGTGVAARYGILIKDAETLETLHRINTIAFDKTGTLTEGKPSLIAYQAVDGDNEALLQLSASLQRHSEHPLAKAIQHAAQGKELQAVTQMQTLAGRGITAQLDDRLLAIGNKRLLQEQAIPWESLKDELKKFEDEGYTLSFVAELSPTPHVLGFLVFGDSIRPESAEAIQRLQGLGLKTVLITGDNWGSAQSVAKTLGIEEYYAEILPEAKAEIITQLKNKTHPPAPLAMLGDGINDAPALAAADIGIAMGGGSDIAMFTAGITLMRSDPRLLIDAISISRGTYRKIWQNLFWAFIYNMIGVPLAALGYLNPMLAGAIMAFSSVSVVLNALWLKRWKPSSLARSPNN